MGMIEDKMAGGQQLPPGAPQPGPQPQDAATEIEADESDPAYQAAIEMAMQVLYKEGGAKDVAQALRSASDPAAALADTTYEMVSTLDERTEGQVPDELLVSLAMTCLGEVADIAEAAGIKVGGREIAAAMQQMIIRYLSENGIDPSQMQQAMSQVNIDELGAQMDTMAESDVAAPAGQEAPAEEI
jgi:hypothetical protein